MCIISSAESAYVQFEHWVYVAQKFMRSRSQPRVVPRRMRSIQLEVIHVSYIRWYVVVCRVDQGLIQIHQQSQFSVFQQSLVVRLPQFLGLLRGILNGFQF